MQHVLYRLAVHGSIEPRSHPIDLYPIGGIKNSRYWRNVPR